MASISVTPGLQAKIAHLSKLATTGSISPHQFRCAMVDIERERDLAMGIKTLSAADRAPMHCTKMVQLLDKTTLAQRQAEIIRTGYNVFNVQAETIYLDLLTDSGTNAMSDKQWAEMILGDERYAFSKTYMKFVDVATRIFNKKHVIPVHQGRAAENVAFEVLLKGVVEARQKTGQKVYCLGNTYFDTTHAHVVSRGVEAIDAPCPEGADTQTYFDFKGNADVAKLEALIKEKGAENIGFIVMTVVNNTIGGQPVSMENLKAVKALAEKYKITYIIDAARIDENAYFIKQREKGYENKSIAEIVQEMSDLADIVLMSGKKDGISNMGGLIATSNEQLYKLFRDRCILIEGHFTYGGMSGRDLAALTQGLLEGIDEDYLRARINQVTELGNELRRWGIPIQWPAGSNGIFVDGRLFFPQIHPMLFPAQSLCAHMYLYYGIRPVEIGLSLAGRDAEGYKVIPVNDLARFTIPRRVFSGDHMALVVEALVGLFNMQNQIGGLTYEEEGAGNGHFTSTFRLIPFDQMSAMLPSVEAYFKQAKHTYAVNYLPPNAIDDRQLALFPAIPPG